MTGDKLNPEELLKFSASCECTGATASKVKYQWKMFDEKPAGRQNMDMSKIEKDISVKSGMLPIY